MPDALPTQTTGLNRKARLTAELRSHATKTRVLLWLVVAGNIAMLGVAIWLILSGSLSVTSTALAGVAGLSVTASLSLTVKLWRDLLTTQMLLKLDLDDEKSALKLIDSLLNAKATK